MRTGPTTLAIALLALASQASGALILHYNFNGQTLDQSGLNKGYYDLPSGAEVSAYFDALMRERFFALGPRSVFSDVRLCRRGKLRVTPLGRNPPRGLS